MTLVGPNHFEFGPSVMNCVSKAMAIETLETDICMTQSAKNRLLKDKDLIKNFLEVTAGQQALDGKAKKKVFKGILQKVINCKFSDVMNVVHEEKIARGSEKNITRAGKTTKRTC